MEILTVSKAKLRIGHLVDSALKGEAVLIRKGERLVRLTEYIMPEPIPERPIGYFRRKTSDYTLANRAVANLGPLR